MSDRDRPPEAGAAGDLLIGQSPKPDQGQPGDETAAGQQNSASGVPDQVPPPWIRGLGFTPQESVEPVSPAVGPDGRPLTRPALVPGHHRQGRWHRRSRHSSRSHRARHSSRRRQGQITTRDMKRTLVASLLILGLVLLLSFVSNRCSSDHATTGESRRDVRNSTVFALEIH